MLLFGSAALYASHLPMFHRPHDYQVLLELELSSPARAAYAASQRDFPAEPVYTLDPEKFVLPDMVAHPRPFRADVYRGHFERGGVRIANGAEVRIRRVVYYRHLQPAEAPAPRPAFVLLGGAQEQFMVHRIGGRPDYDQVLRLVPTPATARLLSRRGRLEWQADSAWAAPLTGAGTVRGKTAARPLPLQVLKPIYFETDDLR